VEVEMSSRKKPTVFGASLVLLCCGAACATKFQSVPDAGSAPTNGAPNGINGAGAGSGGMSSAPTGSGTGTGGMHAVASGGSGGTGAGSMMTSGAGGSMDNGSGGKGVAGGGEAGDGGGSGMAGSGSGGSMAPEMVKCPDTILPPGDSSATVMVGSMMRTYYMHVPASYTGQTPVPLVTDWHPILTNAAFEQGNSGYQQKADSEGFIVVWPEGIDSAWNVGPCCTTSRDVDDVGFARALIDQVKSQACIDPKRIYAVGYSMGGGMSFKLACDAADIIAAVAPAAFELMEENEWPCHPSRPITVIAFNGTADLIVPYEGGASTPPNGLAVTNHFVGAQGTFMKWAELDGCTGSAASSGGDCSTYSQCSAGVEVTSCIKQGGGHESGDPNVAWETLKRFTLP
jgi:polyhydroxybutyrate depolymerase